MCLLEDLVKRAFFHKKSYQLVDLFTICSIIEVNKCVSVDYGSDIGATNKELSDKNDLFYSNC